MTSHLLKDLHPVSGGICAPKGFLANAVCVGVDGKNNKKDFALIVAKKRCVAAGVFSRGRLGDPACLSQKRLKFQCGQVIAVNSGRANLFLENGEEIADDICRKVEELTGISEEDVLVASTGAIGKPLFSQPFVDGMEGLLKGLGDTEEHSLAVAQAMMTTDKTAKHLSYEFYLGPYPCRIGAVFKGNGRVCPNMATTLAFITTDVRISPNALRDILRTEVKDTLNLLDVDGVSSPNDCAIIFASCEAENYIVDREDIDYKKFSCVLREVLREITVRILKDGGRTPLYCRVEEALSKQAARRIAKNLVGRAGVKDLLQSMETLKETLLFALWEEEDISSANVYLKTKGESIVFMQDGEPLPCGEEGLKKLLNGEEYELVVRLGKGNFSATAFGTLKK